MNEILATDFELDKESVFLNKWKKVIEIFLSSIDASATTKESYGKGIFYFAKYLWKKKISSPTQQDIIKYKDELIEKYESATVNAYIVCLIKFYKFLEDNGVAKNITKNVHLIRIDDGDKRDCLTREQLEDLINDVKGNDRELLITLLLCKCALRTIEVSRLNCGNVGTQNGNYVLWVQGKGKVKADECIPISNQMYKLINRYLGQINNKTNEPMFVSVSNSSKGKRLGTRGIRQIMGKHFKNIGINSKKINSHSLRTTCLNILVEEGADVMTVMQYARHRNPETTIKKYINGKNKLNAKVKAMNIMEDIIQV